MLGLFMHVMFFALCIYWIYTVAMLIKDYVKDGKVIWWDKDSKFSWKMNKITYKNNPDFRSALINKIGWLLGTMVSLVIGLHGFIKHIMA